jgi:hypothetical protein
MQDQVLGRDPGAEFAFHQDPQRGRHFEPQAALGPDAGHFRRADAGRERAERAVGGGVGIGAHNDHAGQDVAVLGEHLVADAAAADVVEIGDTLRTDEFAHGLVRGGRFLRFGRHAVVENDDDLSGVPDLRNADLGEALAHQVGVLVGHGQVDLGDDDIIRRHALAPRGTGQDLFRDCHSHAKPPTPPLRTCRAGIGFRVPDTPAGRRKRCIV